jgi:hypothetical protein
LEDFFEASGWRLLEPLPDGWEARFAAVLDGLEALVGVSLRLTFPELAASWFSPLSLAAVSCSASIQNFRSCPEGHPAWRQRLADFFKGGLWSGRWLIHSGGVFFYWIIHSLIPQR